MFGQFSKSEILEKFSSETQVSALSISPSNLTYDHDYFYNKILGQYPDLYREFSNEKFDYYGIIDKSLCPACKLSHKDEKSMVDMKLDLILLNVGNKKLK